MLQGEEGKGEDCLKAPQKVSVVGVGHPKEPPQLLLCPPLTFWSIRQVEVHPAHLGAGLTGHAGAAAPDARAAADDEGQLQNDLLGARDADVDLQG